MNVSESLPIVAVPEGSTAYSDGGIALINKDLLKIHEEVLSKAVARARTPKASLTISSSLREGKPAYEIVNAAKEGGFDVIVIGHRGMGKMEELFFGQRKHESSTSDALPSYNSKIKQISLARTSSSYYVHYSLRMYSEKSFSLCSKVLNLHSVEFELREEIEEVRIVWRGNQRW